MKIVCYREGRVGFQVGDVVEIPDDADAFDGIHFKVLEEPTKTPVEAPVVVPLEAPLAAEAAKADQE